MTLQGRGLGKVTNTATVRAECASQASATAITDVIGVAAILLEVVDITDPIEVGDNETYEITVTNQGSDYSTNVKINCVLVDTMQYTRTETGGCTTASAVYLDFVRDDPNIRCGKIIYIDPYRTPTPPTPTLAPQNVDPPVKGQYQVRLGMLAKTCDPAAKPFAPSFKTAGLSLSPENKLVVDAASTKYELELSNLTYDYSSQKTDVQQDRLGIFTLQQPVTNSFGLMLTLVQMPGQQWTGSWLVTNEEATQLCGGSIDLLTPH